MKKIDLQLKAAQKKYLVDSLDEVKFCQTVVKILAAKKLNRQEQVLRALIKDTFDCAGHDGLLSARQMVSIEANIQLLSNSIDKGQTFREMAEELASGLTDPDKNEIAAVKDRLELERRMEEMQEHSSEDDYELKFFRWVNGNLEKHFPDPTKRATVEMGLIGGFVARQGMSSDKADELSDFIIKNSWLDGIEPEPESEPEPKTKTKIIPLNKKP